MAKLIIAAALFTLAFFGTASAQYGGSPTGSESTTLNPNNAVLNPQNNKQPAPVGGNKWPWPQMPHSVAITQVLINPAPMSGSIQIIPMPNPGHFAHLGGCGKPIMCPPGCAPVQNAPQNPPQGGQGNNNNYQQSTSSTATPGVMKSA